MLGYYWANVVDVGPTLNQHWVNVLCLHEPLEGSTIRTRIGHENRMFYGGITG